MKRSKKDYKWPTVVIVLVSTVGLIVYDIIPAISRPLGDTISEVLRDWSYRYWVIPLAFGVLNGHWFGPAVQPVQHGFWFLIGFGILSLIMGYFNIGHFDPSNWWILVFLGFIMGATFWAQPHI